MVTVMILSFQTDRPEQTQGVQHRMFLVVNFFVFLIFFLFFCFVVAMSILVHDGEAIFQLP